MSRTTKIDRVVTRILNSLREDVETEAAMLDWIRSRYPHPGGIYPNAVLKRIDEVPGQGRIVEP